MDYFSDEAWLHFLMFGGTLYGVAGIGHLIVRWLGWALPRSRSLEEFINRLNWRYAPDIETEQIVRSFLAHSIVVAIAMFCAFAVAINYGGLGDAGR
jgi:hypothetical protein